MVEAAGRLEGRLARLSGAGVSVRLTGPAAMWSDFNAANKAAMLKSEVLSWPLTLVAAGARVRHASSRPVCRCC